ncbi:MAG: hypothetical protein V7739_15480 [Motiliproteus sp.]
MIALRKRAEIRPCLESRARDIANKSCPDPIELQRLVAELQLLLANDLTDANALLHQPEALFKAAYGAKYNQLERQIDGFDYQNALATLKSL